MEVGTVEAVEAVETVEAAEREAAGEPDTVVWAAMRVASPPGT